MANNKTDDSKKKTVKTETTPKTSAANKKPTEKKSAEPNAEKPAVKTSGKAKPVETKPEKPVKEETKKAALKETESRAPEIEAKSEKKSASKVEKKEEVKAAKDEKPEKSADKTEVKSDKTGETKSKKSEKSQKPSPEKEEAEKVSEADNKKKEGEKAAKEEIKPEKEKAPKTKKSEEKEEQKQEPAETKPEKELKIKKEKPERTPEEKKKRNLLIIIISSALAVILAVTAILLCVFWPRKQDIPDVQVPDYDDPIRGSDSAAVYKSDNPQVTKVGYNAEYLGTVERKIPAESKNEGLVERGEIPAYPRYGYTVGMTTAQKDAIINEASWTLPTVNTRIGSDGYPRNTYNKMDANGKLYLNGVDTGRTLYKHTAAAGMYYGDVSDSEPGIVKRVTFNPRGYLRGYGITGLYAPAGEVIKIEISEQEMLATGGIVVHIGQALYNNKANNIWNKKNVNRMPTILNTFVVNTQTATLDNGVYTAYVGSYFGGPVYICNESVKFSVTISGGVRYSHFILGYTTREEYEENKKSSAPYFDLEVWENGVLHSGPKIYAQNFSYDDIYKAAVLWDKIALVSTRRSAQGIVFLYDPFVAAGAAVAFPGQGAVNCPAGWMPGSLNYNSFVNGGAWGNMHEYNHNFQGYGLPYGGEVTNNALTLVEYSLFTRISASRQIGSVGEGQGGWNRHTSPSWAVQQFCDDNPGHENDLSIYSVLLHSFGQENFMQAARTSGTDNYFKLWSSITHQNFTYFSRDVINTAAYAVSDSAAAAMSAYPMFIPAASIYQTGRSYTYDGEKRYCETAQPYVITYGEDFTVDLRRYVFAGNQRTEGSVAIPRGFTYTVEITKQPDHGELVETGIDKVFTYKPDKNHLRSGKIYATLRITKDDGAFNVDDVDLVLEFEQTQERNKTVIERKFYETGSSLNDHKYETAAEAYEKNYAGYELTYEGANRNTAQNCSAEIWAPSTDGYKSMKEGQLNQGCAPVIEISGKLYVPDASAYRIALHGRGSAALYLSFDGGENYELACNMVEDNIGGTDLQNQKYRYDTPEMQTGDWIYFKGVLMAKRYAASYLSIAWGKLENMVGTIEEDGEGNIWYIDASGNKMPVDDMPAETEPYATLGYATAYRNSYEIVDSQFVSDYFYKRVYTVNYDSESGTNAEARIVSSSPCAVGYPADNMLKDDDTYLKSEFSTISAETPFEVTVDLGKEIVASRMEIYGNRENNVSLLPKTFKIYVGSDLDDMQIVGEFSNTRDPGASALLQFNFNESGTMIEKKFRYYKISAAASMGSRIELKKIKFIYRCGGGIQIAPEDEKVTYLGEWSKLSGLHTFGHILVGKDAKVRLNFTGTRFAVKSCFALEYGSFQVFIDGKRADTVSLASNRYDTDYSYLSEILESGSHTVELRGNGTINIDSFVLWS